MVKKLRLFGKMVNSLAVAANQINFRFIKQNIFTQWVNRLFINLRNKKIQSCNIFHIAGLSDGIFQYKLF